MSKTHWYVVGRVGRAHGLKGWLRVFSYTDPPENLMSYQPWQIRKQGSKKSDHLITVKLESYKCLGKHFIVKFEGCEDFESCDCFKHSEIYISSSQLPQLPEGEYYWQDLQGLEVLTAAGKLLGVVDTLFTTQVHDMLSVRHPKTGKIHLVPYSNDVIIQVDLENRRILVNWDEL